MPYLCIYLYGKEGKKEAICLISFEMIGYYCVRDLGGRAPPETNQPQPTFYGIPLVVSTSKSCLPLRQPQARSQPKPMQSTTTESHPRYDTVETPL